VELIPRFVADLRISPEGVHLLLTAASDDDGGVTFADDAAVRGDRVG
jgi:hypothetical protein